MSVFHEETKIDKRRHRAVLSVLHECHCGGKETYHHDKEVLEQLARAISTVTLHDKEMVHWVGFIKRIARNKDCPLAISLSTAVVQALFKCPDKVDTWLSNISNCYIADLARELLGFKGGLKFTNKLYGHHVAHPTLNADRWRYEKEWDDDDQQRVLTLAPSTMLLVEIWRAVLQKCSKHLNEWAPGLLMGVRVKNDFDLCTEWLQVGSTEICDFLIVIASCLTFSSNQLLPDVNAFHLRFGSVCNVLKEQKAKSRNQTTLERHRPNSLWELKGMALFLGLVTTEQHSDAHSFDEESWSTAQAFESVIFGYNVAMQMRRETQHLIENDVRHCMRFKAEPSLQFPSAKDSLVIKRGLANVLYNYLQRCRFVRLNRCQLPCTFILNLLEQDVSKMDMQMYEQLNGLAGEFVARDKKWLNLMAKARGLPGWEDEKLGDDLTPETLRTKLLEFVNSAMADTPIQIESTSVGINDERRQTGPEMSILCGWSSGIGQLILDTHARFMENATDLQVRAHDVMWRKRGLYIDQRAKEFYCRDWSGHSHSPRGRDRVGVHGIKTTAIPQDEAKTKAQQELENELERTDESDNLYLTTFSKTTGNYNEQFSATCLHARVYVASQGGRPPSLTEAADSKYELELALAICDMWPVVFPCDDRTLPQKAHRRNALPPLPNFYAVGINGPRLYRTMAKNYTNMRALALLLLNPDTVDLVFTYIL